MSRTSASRETTAPSCVLVAVLVQALDAVGTDESGATGDENELVGHGQQRNRRRANIPNGSELRSRRGRRPQAGGPLGRRLGHRRQWLLRSLEVHSQRLRGRYGVTVRVVGVANAHEGFAYRERGWSCLAGRRVDRRAGRRRALADSARGLRATEADVLVEVTGSRSSDGEPGLSHMREALERAIPVVTSNKWPVALAGVELAALARSRGVAFRAESTVMSGTPC